MTMMLLPLVTRTTSRAAAHQFRFALDPLSLLPAKLAEASPSAPSAPTYESSKTAPFLRAVPTSVCLRLNGRRGAVRGSDIMCAVSGDGFVCSRHAEEKETAVVGSSAIRSYGANNAAFPVVCTRRSRGATANQTRERTNPKPFSLSSSSTIVSLFR